MATLRAGMLSNERVFAAVATQCAAPRDEGEGVGAAVGAAGVPDGLAVDAEGGVWVCLWDAGKVVRYLPAPGGGGGGSTVDRIIEMPCSRPTSACFGGAGSDFSTTLFITSCSVDTTVDKDAKSLSGDEPLAGAVFAVEVGVAGVPVHKASF